MVANVKTGALEIVPDSTKVVDGLLAATAVSPLFPPKSILNKLYLDGANISPEATSGLLTLLRDRIHPYASVVHLYSVSHLPFGRRCGIRGSSASMRRASSPR
jgi:predicted acylesterase/phospholipase RssA